MGAHVYKKSQLISYRKKQHKIYLVLQKYIFLSLSLFFFFVFSYRKFGNVCLCIYSYMLVCLLMIFISL